MYIVMWVWWGGWRGELIDGLYENPRGFGVGEELVKSHETFLFPLPPFLPAHTLGGCFTALEQRLLPPDAVFPPDAPFPHPTSPHTP